MIQITIECAATTQTYIPEELHEKLNVVEEYEWRKGFIFIDDISMIYEARDPEYTLIEKKGGSGFFRVKGDLETIALKIKAAKKLRNAIK